MLVVFGFCVVTIDAGYLVLKGNCVLAGGWSLRKTVSLQRSAYHNAWCKKAHSAFSM